MNFEILNFESVNSAEAEAFITAAVLAPTISRSYDPVQLIYHVKLVMKKNALRNAFNMLPEFLKVSFELSKLLFVQETHH